MVPVMTSAVFGILQQPYRWIPGNQTIVLPPLRRSTTVPTMITFRPISASRSLQSIRTLPRVVPHVARPRHLREPLRGVGGGTVCREDGQAESMIGVRLHLHARDDAGDADRGPGVDLF